VIQSKRVAVSSLPLPPPPLEPVHVLSPLIALQEWTSMNLLKASRLLQSVPPPACLKAVPTGPLSGPLASVAHRYFTTNRPLNDKSNVTVGDASPNRSN